MRDEQAPDRTGRTLPPTLDRGQFHWSTVATPGESHIIGRAEVVSRSGHVVSSYSCPVCCPDSGPYGGFDPDAYGLYIDGIAATSSRGDYYDCYWNSYPSTIWWSSLSTWDSSVATFTSGTEDLYGQGAGFTYAVGSYNQIYYENDGMDCYQRYDSPTDSASVDVPNSEIVLTNAKLYELTAAFEGPGITSKVAILNAGSSAHANDICGNNPQEFTIRADFTLPTGGELVTSRCSASALGVPDQNYNVGTPTCQMDEGLVGHISIPARRRCCGGPDDHPSIHFVIGANKAGQTGTIDTPGTVRVLCNQ